MANSRPPSDHPRPVVLCVLDGWGDRHECEDNAICSATAPEWHHLIKDWPNARGPGLGRGRRPARRPDGQFRGRPHEPRRRACRHAGHAAHRRRHRRRQPRGQPGARRFLRPPQEKRRHLPPARPDLAGRRPFPPERDCRARAHDRRKGRAGRAPRLPRRARHAAPERARLPREIRERYQRRAGTGHRHRYGTLLCHGPRQALGPGRARLPRHRRGRRRARRQRQGRGRGRLRARRDTTSSWCRPRSPATPARSDGDGIADGRTSAPTARARSCSPCSIPASTASRASTPSPSPPPWA